MAAWMVWKDTRFFTSHDDVFIPVSNLQCCLEHKAVESQVQWTQDKTNFLKNQALHYLCRSKDLEDLCVFDFYQEYKSANLTKKLRDDGDYYKFEKDMGHFKHPGWTKLDSGKDRQHCMQAMVPREVPVLGCVSQWPFPNAASFKVNLFTCRKDEITESMDMYAYLVMVLFYPFCCSADLMATTAGIQSYALRLCQLYMNKMNNKS
jgi:hypothetical protein